MYDRLKLNKKVYSESDNTIKYVFNRTHDDYIIEFSYINKNDGKNIICVPCQTMCNIGCKFCHATDYVGKYKATLIIGIDIADGVDYIYNDLKLGDNPKTLLISYMGIGEPVVNYKNVIDSMLLIKSNYKDIYVRFAISTSLPDIFFTDFFEMVRLVKGHDLPVKLHVSLHYTNDIQRKEWMPRAVNIKSTIAAAEFFKEYTGNPVEIHYALIDKVNDTVIDAIELSKILNNRDFNVKFLFYNEKSTLNIHPSKMGSYEVFKRELNDKGITCEYYVPPGLKIGSSCGSFNLNEYIN